MTTRTVTPKTQGTEATILDVRAVQKVYEAKQPQRRGDPRPHLLDPGR